MSAAYSDHLPNAARSHIAVNQEGIMKHDAKIIAVYNQKGGVGKTVTSVNLGIGFARKGKRVLLVDVDTQGSLTVSLGISIWTRWKTPW